MRCVLWVRVLFTSLYHFLYRPWRVVQMCLLVACVNLIFDGSLFQFFGLHLDLRDIQHKIQQTQHNIADLQYKKKQSSKSHFIKMQAINRFNVAHKNDLVFIFSGDE